MSPDTHGGHHYGRAVLTAVVLVISAMVAACDDGSDITDRVTSGASVPARQMALIEQMVDAINDRDVGAFVGLFAPEGAFNPRGDFRESTSLFGNTLPVSNTLLVQAWKDILEAWGLGAELVDCSRTERPEGTYGDGSDLFVACEVATKWHTLSMEITEGWSFELRDSQLMWWNSPIGMNQVDGGVELLELNPAERDLPLGFDGLEAWEAWVTANHPDEAARILNPRRAPSSEILADLPPGNPLRDARLSPLLANATNDWAIDGHVFSPAGLIPYDPAFAAEIEASVEDYLESLNETHGGGGG